MNLITYTWRQEVFILMQNINIFSKYKVRILLLILGFIPICLINKYPVRSNSMTEKVAFCQKHAGSYVPYNDPNYQENYEVVYNYCIKEVEKQIIKLSYEKERGELSPIERKEMKNKLVNISSEMQSKCEGNKKEISSGFLICDLVMGKGRTAANGDYVFVEYIGEILNGEEFDTSYARPSFFPFTLGQGRVIKGWDQGVQGMKEGGIRKLVIPPELAYGSQKKGDKIPPNSTLVFLVQLLKVN